MRVMWSLDVFLVAVAVLVGEVGSFFFPTDSVALVSARHPKCIKDFKRDATTAPKKALVGIQRGEKKMRGRIIAGGLDEASLRRWPLGDGDSGEGGGGRRGGSNGDHGRSEGDDAWGKEGPELFLAATGMASALNGVAEVLQSLRSPRNHQDESDSAGQGDDASSLERYKEELAKVVVSHVLLNKSAIPRDVLASAAVESGLLGREASADRIKACAEILNRWYKHEGFLLSSVSNAVVSSNGTVSFIVFEPVISSTEPVKLTFYKIGAYGVRIHDFYSSKQSYLARWISPRNASDPSSDVVPVERGKTKPRTVAWGLGLKGGEHFRMDAKRWGGILGSGLFSGAQLAGAHRSPGDTGVTLDVDLEERRTVVFEPGVTKTLFDSNWAGEICFEERNVLGLNGVLGLDVRRTMASPFTSFSLRLGNNRFGQPGAWQVSLFRDTIAPSGGYTYAGGAIGTASSAPVFSTASPDGTPRDLGILARSLRGSRQDRVDDIGSEGHPTVVSAAAESHREVSKRGKGSGKGMGRSSTDVEASRCHGVSLSTSWPFSFVRAAFGASYQQVSALGNPFEQHGPHPQPRQSGGREGAMDVVSLSGGLSKHWPLPSALLGRLSGSFRKDEASTESGDLKMEGSVSSFLDVKTGCMFAEGAAPQPFAQELATLVQRVPVGPNGRAGCWNVTLNVKQQLQRSSGDTPLHQVPPFGGQRTVRGFAEGELGHAKEYALATAEVRVPLRNFLGKLSAEGVVFADLGAFRPMTSPGGSVTKVGRHVQRVWDTAGAPRGGGFSDEEDSSEQELRTEELFPTNEGGRVVHDGRHGLKSSLSADAWTLSEGEEARREHRAREGERGGLRVHRGQGLGLRIGGLIQIDVGVSRGGMKQVHIGLVDRNF